MKMRTAEAAIHVLLREGVSAASGVPGAAINEGPRMSHVLQPSRYQLCTEDRSLAQPESDSTRLRFAPATCGR